MNSSDPVPPASASDQAPGDGRLADATHAIGLGLASPSRLAALGIDAELGLRYCGGNAALYRRALDLFHDEYLLPFEKQWNSECNSQDVQARRRLAHSFKGVCASVGATALRDAAARLETALGEYDTQAVEQIAFGLIDSLSSFRDALKQSERGNIAP